MEELSMHQEKWDHFKDLSREWLELRKCSIRESTQQKYESLIKGYLDKYFDLKTEEITTQNINRKLSEMYQDYAETLSHSTFKTLLYLVKSIVRYGMNIGYIRDVSIVFELPRMEKRKEILVLKETQENALIAQILEEQTPGHLGILIALNTGLRIGEICSLKMKDINFEEGTISVSRTVQRLKAEEGGTRMVISQPKSDQSSRKIPLTGFLNKVLISYHLDWKKEENFVLSGSEKPYDPRTLQYAFSKESKAYCGCSLRFHSLRHTFATKCVQAGFDLKTLSEILGHASVSFTMNRYVHSDMEMKKKQMKLIDREWE